MAAERHAAIGLARRAVSPQVIASRRQLRSPINNVELTLFTCTRVVLTLALALPSSAINASP